MSVQLIKNNKNSLEICDEGLEALKKLDHSFATCICVGPYRQGKSFLLNLLTETNAFELGHTDRSCTKGVWMHPKPIKMLNSSNEETNVIFFDTEGLESDDSNGKWDTKLFLVSLIIGSYFVYNTKNCLSKDALDKLSVVTKIHKQLKLKDMKPGHRETLSLQKELPDFMWVVRDFALSTTKKPSDRLNDFLELENTAVTDDEASDDDSSSTSSAKTSRSKASPAETRNAIRSCIQTTFRSLDCHYLPVPISDGVNGLSFEEALQSLGDLDFDDLRPAFKSSLYSLVDKVSEQIVEKSVGSQRMNGDVFAEFLVSAVEAINANEVVCMQTIAIKSMRTVASRVLAEVKKTYRDTMIPFIDSFGDDTPISMKSLSDKEIETSTKCLKILDAKTSLLGDDAYELCSALFTQYRDKYKTSFDKTNREHLNVYADHVASVFWEERFAEKVNDLEYKSVHDFDRDLTKFQLLLESKLTVLTSAEFSHFFDHFKIQSIRVDTVKAQLENKILKAELEQILREKREAEDEVKRTEMKNMSIQAEIDRLERLNEVELRKPKVDRTPEHFLPTFPFATPPKTPNSTRYLKLDGTPDLRYAENRKHMISPEGIHLKKDGTPDLRYKENRQHLISPEGIRLNQNGTPDMRFKVNKQLFGPK